MDYRGIEEEYGQISLRLRRLIRRVIEDDDDDMRRVMGIKITLIPIYVKLRPKRRLGFSPNPNPIILTPNIALEFLIL